MDRPKILPHYHVQTEYSDISDNIRNNWQIEKTATSPGNLGRWFGNIVQLYRPFYAQIISCKTNGYGICQKNKVVDLSKQHLWYNNMYISVLLQMGWLGQNAEMQNIMATRNEECILLLLLFSLKILIWFLYSFELITSNMQK